jgi:glycosyltransferase involved in cell wall biosynthesis
VIVHEPLVSAVIHYLDAEKYLECALQSVRRQTCSRWELVLVDGGSTDGSPAIARSFQSEIPGRVQIPAHEGEPPLGIFSSRLWGASQARSTVVALLDSDDEWHEQFLQRQWAIDQDFFQQRPGIVYCPVVYWWGSPGLAAQSFVQTVPPPGLHEPPGLLVPFVEREYEQSAANSAGMVARALLLEAASLIGVADEGWSRTSVSGLSCC